MHACDVADAPHGGRPLRQITSSRTFDVVLAPKAAPDGLYLLEEAGAHTAWVVVDGAERGATRTTISLEPAPARSRFSTGSDLAYLPSSTEGTTTD
jgi:hypothetical protein